MNGRPGQTPQTPQPTPPTRAPAGAVAGVLVTALTATWVAGSVHLFGTEVPGIAVAALFVAAAVAALVLPRPAVAERPAARLAGAVVFGAVVFVVGRSARVEGTDDYQQLAGPLLCGALLLAPTWTTPARIRVTLAITLPALLVAAVAAPVQTAVVSVIVWMAGAAWALAVLDGHARAALDPLTADGPPRPTTGGRRALDVLALLALLAVLLLAVVVVDPHPPRPPWRAGGDATGQESGFAGRYLDYSDELDTGFRFAGEPSDAAVLRVEAPAPDFWRGQTFDEWDGRAWRRGGGFRGQPFPASSAFVPPGLGDTEVEGQRFEQRVTVEAASASTVFGAYRLAELAVPSSFVLLASDVSVRLPSPVGRGATYTVVSDRPLVTADLLRADDPRGAPLPEAIASAYLQLPDGVPERVSALATTVTAGAPTTYDAVLALEAWLGDNTTYTLDIPPLPDGADAVEQFLFVDRRGFCEQIASSLAVLLRSVGVPARVATGFVPGDESLLGGEFTVRARDAHAWVEVWFPTTGWQGFDPTASVPLSGEYEVGILARLRSLAGRLWWLLAIVGAAVALVLAVVVVRWLRRWLARRRSRSWAEVAFRRMTSIGAARGRPRGASETPIEYASALARWLDVPELEQVGAMVTAAAWGGEGDRRPDAVAEEWVDGVLQEAGKRRPTREPVAVGARAGG